MSHVVAIFVSYLLFVVNSLRRISWVPEICEWLLYKFSFISVVIVY